ncbi:MAG: hypothetical protein IPM40_00205 [Gammaproteobacteria bacterium]|nr:hypothetical protein [Gammaproteobacteria bacterium]
MSVLAWAVIIPAAIFYKRYRFRLLRFALLWFVAGHLLESTVIGLELYFEHRNYMPSVGVWIALAGWTLTGSISPRLRLATLGVLAGAQIFVLLESARVWSDRDAASAVWAYENPASQRALMFRSTTLAQRGDADGILQLIREADPSLQSLPDFLFQKLDVYCSMLPEAEVRPVVEQLRQELRTKAAGHFSGLLLASVARRVEQGGCRGISREEVLEFFQSMSVPGPQFSSSLQGIAHQHLVNHWIEERNLDQAMHHARLLFQIAPTVDTAELMVDMLLSADLYDDANELLPWFRAAAPNRPFIRDYWLENMTRIEQKIQRMSVVNAVNHDVN